MPLNIPAYCFQLLQHWIPIPYNHPAPDTMDQSSPDILVVSISVLLGLFLWMLAQLEHIETLLLIEPEIHNCFISKELLTTIITCNAYLQYLIDFHVLKRRIERHIVKFCCSCLAKYYINWMKLIIDVKWWQHESECTIRNRVINKEIILLINILLYYIINCIDCCWLIILTIKFSDHLVETCHFNRFITGHNGRIDVQ